MVTNKLYTIGFIKTPGMKKCPGMKKFVRGKRTNFQTDFYFIFFYEKIKILKMSIITFKLNVFI